MNHTYNPMTYGRTEDIQRLIIQQVEKGCKTIHSHAEIMVKAYYKELASKIPGWIENYRCYHHVDNIFKVKSQAMAFTEELVNSLQKYIKGETIKWADEQFVPLVGREIHTMKCSVGNRTSIVNEPLGRLDVTIDINKNSIIKNTTPSTKNKIISTGTSLLIGDLGGAIMGGAGGSDAMFKTMGCEFAAGVALGIISLFTPIGLVTFVGGVIASAFVGESWALGSIEKKIKKAVTKSCMEKMNSQEEISKFLNVVHNRIDCLLKPMLQEL